MIVAEYNSELSVSGTCCRLFRYRRR